MGDWSYLSELLDKVQSYSTRIGKTWMTVFFIFRILVLGAAADAVWGDEHSDFLCNQKEPGCEIACYDWMFPISHIRFWVLQILFVSTPTLVYLGYAIHVIHREDKLKEQLQSQMGSPGLKKLKYINDKGKVRIRGVLLRSTMAQLFAKIALEVAFIVGQYYLYGFFMVQYFDCRQDPCPRTGVECYTSRPTEKTIFIIYMLVVACVSVLLNVIEVVYLTCSYVKRGYKKKVLTKHQVNSAESPASLLSPEWKADMDKRLVAEMVSMQNLENSCAEEEKQKHS